MNNRQKAKHFKRLYEQSLGKLNTVRVSYMFPKHYELSARVLYTPYNNVYDDEEDKRELCRILMRDMGELVKRNMKIETEEYSKRATLDVWMEK